MFYYYYFFGELFNWVIYIYIYRNRNAKNLETVRERDYLGDLVIDEKVLLYLLICFPFI